MRRPRLRIWMMMAVVSIAALWLFLVVPFFVASLDRWHIEVEVQGEQRRKESLPPVLYECTPGEDPVKYRSRAVAPDPPKPE
jgi:hypothetical protein